MLGGELTHHLGYPVGGNKPEDSMNHRNGTGGRPEPAAREHAFVRAGEAAAQAVASAERSTSGVTLALTMISAS